MYVYCIICLLLRMTMGAVGRRAMLVSLVDLAWSALVVAPLVVLFWRGTWDILTLWVKQISEQKQRRK